MQKGLTKMSNKTKYLLFTAFVVFCVLVLALSSAINYKGLSESSAILEDSVRAQLISTASAAREVIDAAAFYGYNRPEDIQNSAYEGQLDELRQLAVNTGAAYIYALKMIDDKPVFIFDTDIECEPFTEYELAPVLAAAFSGKDSAGISNLVDEFGSFSTGAVPIMRDGHVIGIACVDVEDDLLVAQRASAQRNFWLMIGMLASVLAIMSALVYYMLSRVKIMQDRLKRMANYDKLTNLPNRQYLMDTLQEMTSKKAKAPFALFFIDLDNFKQVNDNAGHDAGDALLQNIGHYLEHAQNNSKVFRPGPGILNVAARIGGDEFILIVPAISNQNDAEAFAQELLNGFATQEIDRYIDKYHVGLSIGIALFPFNSQDYNVLIKYADIAMYHAKRAGKNCYRVYEDEMTDKDEKQ